MSKILRKTQKQFASTATAAQIAKFGSLAAGSPVTYSGVTADPDNIQALANYLSGWFAGVVGSNLPAIEDMNALCFLFAYQLAYIFQAGVAEWDSGTTYYTNSFVQSGGSLYISLVDTNLNNAVSDTAKWKAYNQPTVTSYQSTVTSSATLVIPAGVSYVRVEAITNWKALENFQSQAGNLGVLDAFGNLYTWGNNANGELGAADVVARSSPTLVVSPAGFKWKRLMLGGTLGAGANFAITNQNQIYSWGFNTVGELGLGTVTPASSPTLVIAPAITTKFVKMAGCGTTVMALAKDGKLYGWGRNVKGGVGTGATVDISTPTLVVGGFTWQDVWVGGGGDQAFCFGLTTAGALYAWGFNANGQLGLGDVVSRSSPVLVLGGLTFTQLAVDNDYAVLGIDNTGAAYGWGINANGQLGVGSVIPKSSPVLVLGSHTWKQIGISLAQSYGLDTAGVAYMWGLTGNGGNVAADTPVSSPVLVQGGITFSKLAVLEGGGTEVSGYGIKSDGTLYAWGDNSKGQLGLGDTTYRSSPVLVVGGNKWDNVYPVNNNNSMVMGVDQTGNVYCWGAGNNGTLGTGSTTASSSPTLVVAAFNAQVSTWQGAKDPSPTQTFAVTPGSSYVVVVAPNSFSTFNGSVIGYQISGLKVIYET